MALVEGMLKAAEKFPGLKRTDAYSQLTKIPSQEGKGWTGSSKYNEKVL